VRRQLDQRISETTFAKPVVVSPRPPRKWLESGAKRRAAHGIQEATHRNPALAAQKLERPRLHRVDLLAEELAGVGGVACVRAVVTEAADRVLERACEQRSFIELPTRRRRADGTRAPGEQGEVGEADPAFGHCVHGGGESICLLANRNGVRGRSCGHPALVPDPIDRAHGAMALVLLSCRETGGDGGELELQEVRHVPDPDQLLAEALRRPASSRAVPKPVDSCLERR
jgi:hypothetical protein